MKTVRWCFRIFVTAVLLFWLIGELFWAPDAPQGYKEASEVTLDWQQIEPDGTERPFDAKNFSDFVPEQEMVFTAKLPEHLEDNRYLCFQVSRQDVELSVDREVRGVYLRKDTSLFGNNGSSLLYFINVNAKDSGKELMMRTRMAYQNVDIFSGIYYGDYQGIWMRYFAQSGYEVILAFVLIVLGVLMVAFSLWTQRRFPEVITLKYVGWAIILAAIWLVGNSNLRQLIYPNLAVANDMNFYMVMLLPLPLSFFVDELQEERYHRRHLFASVVASVNFVVSGLLNLTGLWEYVATFPAAAAVCGLMMVTIVSSILQDLWTRRIRRYWIVAIGLLGAFVSGAIQIVLYLTEFAYLNNNVVMDIGIVIVLVTTIVSTGRDIIRGAQKKNKELADSAAKNAMFAEVSHEIRTPINAIIGMDSMILRETGEQRTRTYAQDIYRASHQLLALVNDVLDFSKLDTGKLQIHPVDFRLAGAILDVLTLISIRAKEKGLELLVDVQEELPRGVRGDDVRIKQILTNLLTNAIKYTDEGTVSLTVNGSLEGHKARLVFSVQDTGVGIRKEDMQRIFAEFERVDEDKNRHIEGTGLGLDITQRLLYLMGSELHVESTYEEGSRFWFSLVLEITDERPIGNLRTAEEEAEPDENYQSAFVAPEARVLVVDDNEINRKVFCGLLAGTEIQIDEAGSGPECLRRVAEVDYDLIFMDHMMPEMDGVQTLEAMRQMSDHRCAHTPVIALTANASDDARRYYLSVGFDGFLSKPMNPAKLEALLLQELPKQYITRRDALPEAQGAEPAAEALAELPNFAFVNWQEALGHFGSRAMMEKTVAEFCDAAEHQAVLLEEKLSEAQTSHDGVQAYRVQVHAMKGNANLIGALELGARALTLEQAAREEHLETLVQETPEFLEVWRAQTGMLRAYFGSKSDAQTEKVALDLHAVSVRFTELGEAFEQMDVDRIDAVMDAIQAYAYDTDVAADIDQLTVLAAELDGEAALPLIDAIKQKLGV